MNKLIYSDELQDALVKAAGVISFLIEDKEMVKSAVSSAITRKLIQDNLPDDDHFGVHLISLGAEESYGFNKNGDSWPRAGLMHEGGNFGHHTFTKYGHFFREHDHDDPKKKIGIIKAQAFNEPMDRGELIIWGDKRKAEEQYEKAKSGKQLTFSMSAKVPWDECSCCEKQAKRSKEYCVHLKKAMTQWLPKFKKFAYAINREPKFFDISEVANRADRIALYLEYMLDKDHGMAKAASASGDFIFSDQMAEAVGVRELELPAYGCMKARNQQWLNKLAALETIIANPGNDERGQFIKQCAQPISAMENVIAENDLKVMRQLDPEVLWYFMAKRAAVLPFNVFFAYCTNQSLEETSKDAAFKLAKLNLNSIFSKLQEAPAEEKTEALFIPGDSVKAAASWTEDPLQPTLEKLTRYHAINKKTAQARVFASFVINSVVPAGELKSAAVVSEEVTAKADQLNRAYAFYKIAFCEAVREMHGEEFIDEPAQILIISQR